MTPTHLLGADVFGVAAVGPGGHESTINPYVMAPRND